MSKMKKAWEKTHQLPCGTNSLLRGRKKVRGTRYSTCFSNRDIWSSNALKACSTPVTRASRWPTWRMTSNAMQMEEVFSLNYQTISVISERSLIFWRSCRAQNAKTSFLRSTALASSGSKTRRARNKVIASHKIRSRLNSLRHKIPSRHCFPIYCSSLMNATCSSNWCGEAAPSASRPFANWASPFSASSNRCTR